MKKNILFFACFLLVLANAHAEVPGRQPRDYENATNTKPGRDWQGDATVFTNVATTGHKFTGNASFIALTAADIGGNVHTYYLWVDGATSAGTLMMASQPVITTYASFPYGDMRSTVFKAGSAVGSQS